MKTCVKKVSAASGIKLEYARIGDRRDEAGRLADTGWERERIKELLAPLVKEAVQKQWKEQQDYYKSRPSLAARQLGQMFGAGTLERAVIPAVSTVVYEKVEERLRQEYIRKGR